MRQVMCSYEDISKQSFELALRIATQKLSMMKAEEICLKSGVSQMDNDHLLIHYLGQPYQVTLSTGEVLYKDKEGNVPVKDQILILHYLIRANGTPFTHKVITYGQIEGGKFYVPVFIQRNIHPLLKSFGQRPERLLDLAQKIGGIKATYGDVSFSIDPFPRVRIFFILWKGDDEIPPNGNILFDGNIPHYLTSEDVCVLTETLVWKLINISKTSP